MPTPTTPPLEELFSDAIFADNLVGCKLLIDIGCDCTKIQNEGGENLIVEAARGFAYTGTVSIEMFEFLCIVLDVNEANDYDGRVGSGGCGGFGGGITPLFASLHTNNLEVCKVLVKHGAKINIIDDEGWNALSYIALHADIGIEEAVKMAEKQAKKKAKEDAKENAKRVEAERVEAERIEGKVEADASKPCSHCGNNDAGVEKFPCGACGESKYCGRLCRRAHWKDAHKEECKVLC